MKYIKPGELEIYTSFRLHTGPRFIGAGLRIQFHYNQIPGIHFRLEPPEEYRSIILRSIEERMAVRFPDFPSTASIWITEITGDPAEWNGQVFSQVSRLVIDQAYSLVQVKEDHYKSHQQLPPR